MAEIKKYLRIWGIFLEIKEFSAENRITAKKITENSVNGAKTKPKHLIEVNSDYGVKYLS